MHQECHGLAGKLTIRKYTRDGDLVEEVSTHNDITLSGRALVARLFNHDLTGGDDNIKRISQVGVGGSGEPFDPKQNRLVMSIGDPVDIERIEEHVTPDNRIMLRLVAELKEDQSNGELREAGLFTDAAEPVMYNRVTFAPINKSAQFRLTLVWEITF